MTGLLMRAIWFPADSRLNVVSPGAVFRIIGTRGEESALNIMENRKQVGTLTITPASRAADQQGDVQIGIKGKIRLKGGILPPRQLIFDGDFSVNFVGELSRLNLTLSMKEEMLVMELRMDSPKAEPSITLSRGGMTLLDTRNVELGSRLEASPFAAILLGMVGLSPGEVTELRQQATAEASATTVEARQGEFEIEGIPHRGYLITVLNRGQKSFRVCVGNTGQILSLETPTSYQMISADLLIDESSD